MKLNEILINNKIVKYNDKAPIGMRYVVVDESMNRVISTHPTKELAFKKIKPVIVEQKKNLFENFNFDGKTWPVGSVFQLDSQGTRWGVGLGVDDEIIEFEGRDARAAARNLVDNLPSGQTAWDRASLETAASSRRMPRGVTAKVEPIDTNWRNRRATVDSFAALERLKNVGYVGPTLVKILESPWWRGFNRIVSSVGIPAAVIWTNIGIINDLEEEAQQNPNMAQENYELRNIILSQTSAQIAFFLGFAVFGNANYLNRALRAIKWTVRAAQGSAALTGVGAIPSALSFLLTEAGWLVAGWILQSETVQRALAEYIHDSMFSEFFQASGQAIAGGIEVLDILFDGRFGTGALLDAIKWESQQTVSAEEGEFASSSEWAKLVFHGLLFPPGKENMLVPYIPPEQRATMLRETLGISQDTPDSAPTTDQPQASPGANPNTSSEPGLPVNPDARTGPQ